MTKEESILISAFTGYVLTPKFSDMYEFIEETMGRPVFTHEMGNEDFMDEVREMLLPQIKAVMANIDDA